LEGEEEEEEDQLLGLVVVVDLDAITDGIGLMQHPIFTDVVPVEVGVLL
jgi:hypothetical protein